MNINLVLLRMFCLLSVTTTGMAAQATEHQSDTSMSGSKNKAAASSAQVTKKRISVSNTISTCKQNYFGTYILLTEKPCAGDFHQLMKMAEKNNNFGKIKPQQVLNYLQTAGFVDAQTGQIKLEQYGLPVVKLYFVWEHDQPLWMIFRLDKTEEANTNTPADFNDPPFYPLFAVMDGNSGDVHTIDSVKNAHLDPQTYFAKLLRKQFLWQNISVEEKKIILRILTEMRNAVVEELASAAIESEDEALINAGLDVLRFGDVPQLESVNKIMTANSNPKLRIRSAQVMQQIGHNNPLAQSIVFFYINEALRQEKNSKVIEAMIVTIQNLYHRQYGLRADQNGHISGDVVAAKQKCLQDLDEFIHSKNKKNQ